MVKKRTVLDITNDISIGQWQTQLADPGSEASMQILENLEDLYKELSQKEDGVYWLYKKI